MVKKTSSAKADANRIQRKAGLSGIRAKATMYIGPTDSSGLWTIWREPGDNAADLTLKGLNKSVHLIADPNKVGYWVIDSGPGFPVKMDTFISEHGQPEKLNTFYVATGLPHAGSNFDSDNASRGTHGIGIKATNAMSKLFKVITFSKGEWWEIQYLDAKLSKEPFKSKAPKLPHGIKIKSGTALYFEPDLKLFDKGSKMQLEEILEWCDISSYLVPNFSIQYTNAKGKSRTFKTKGLSEYVNNLIAKFDATQNGKTFFHQDTFVDVAIAFTSADNDTLNAFTNGLKNAAGGVHADAVYSAIAKSLKPYQGKLKFQPADLRSGLLGLVNCKIPAPRFNNQKKDGLLDDRAKEVTLEPVTKALSTFWSQNKKMAQEICKRASELRKLTMDFKADRDLIKKAKGATRGMSKKFAGISDSKTPIEDRELYIVEGDSAGGTAKQARNKKFQATFAIRGKPLNVMDAPKAKIHGNKEITGILAGIGMTDEKKAEAINFGKIIFLADPDVDGHHINCLLMTMFYKLRPDLYEKGKIFLLKSPEYMTSHKGKFYYGETKEDIYKQIGNKNVDVQHVKGWGELNADEMEPIAFDTSTRQLIQILPPSNDNEHNKFKKLMGSNADYRKAMLGVI